jgi:hypothetical protein
MSTRLVPCGERAPPKKKSGGELFQRFIFLCNPQNLTKRVVSSCAKFVLPIFVVHVTTSPLTNECSKKMWSRRLLICSLL